MAKAKHNWQAIALWKAVCKYHKVDPSYIPSLRHIPEFMHGFHVASYRLALIVKAINGKWEADWNNGGQRKWWGWFWMNKGGFRFYASLFDWTYSDTSGGSRLCCETEEQFMHLVTHFLDFLEDFYTGRLRKKIE